MRLYTDNEIDNSDRHTLTQMLWKWEYLSLEAGQKHAITQLKGKVKKYQRTRFIYMLARCPSDDHQLLYSHEQLDDIIYLKNKVKHIGILINNWMRVFKGDNPVAQLESGLQKNYFCCQCPLFFNSSPNIVHTMSLPTFSWSNFKSVFN